MKRLLILLLVIITQSAVWASYVDKQIEDTKNNEKYNTVQYHKKNFDKTLSIPTTLPEKHYKDPGLITISSVTPIDKNLYTEKIKADEIIYKSSKKSLYKKMDNTLNINPFGVDFYAVYRVSERLIRANNLDYVNWRIAIRKSDDPNAYSFSGNNIHIHTSLFDTFYDNEDALAFIFAHEMAHLILGHSQRDKENLRKTRNMTAMACIPFAGPFIVLHQVRGNFDAKRMMEYMADAEALKLLITAGYDPEKAISAITYFETTPNVPYIWATHPRPYQRYESLMENAQFIDPNWVEIGKNNIYNSNVLKCKKSSDRVSIVITQSKNPKGFYKPENIEEKLTRFAYISYKKGNMKEAAKYFSKLAEIKNDYVSYLYLSYAYEYLYEQSHLQEDLTNAKKAAKMAKKLCKDNTDIINQYKELKDL